MGINPIKIIAIFLGILVAVIVFFAFASASRLQIESTPVENYFVLDTPIIMTQKTYFRADCNQIENGQKVIEQEGVTTRTTVLTQEVQVTKVLYKIETNEDNRIIEIETNVSTKSTGIVTPGKDDSIKPKFELPCDLTVGRYMWKAIIELNIRGVDKPYAYETETFEVE